MRDSSRRSQAAKGGKAMGRRLPYATPGNTIQPAILLAHVRRQPATKTSALHPKPEALAPTPATLSPKPYTLNADEGQDRHAPVVLVEGGHEAHIPLQRLGQGHEGGTCTAGAQPSYTANPHTRRQVCLTRRLSPPTSP
jgi:hypothetical protein